MKLFYYFNLIFTIFQIFSSISFATISLKDQWSKLFNSFDEVPELSTSFWQPIRFKTEMSKLDSELATWVSQRNDFGFYAQQTFLTLAIIRGDVEIVSWILENLPSALTTLPKTGSSPLHLASLKEDASILKILLKQNLDPQVKDQSHFSPLHYAAQAGSVDAVSVLAEAGINLTEQGKDNITPLHVAAKYGHVSIANKLFELSNLPIALLNATDSEGRTPLHVAAYYGQTHFAENLIRLGASASIKDRNGRTPHDYAESRGHMDSEDLVSDKTSALLEANQSENQLRRSGRKSLKRKFLRDEDLRNLQSRLSSTDSVEIFDFGKPMGRGLKASEFIPKGSIVALYPIDVIDEEKSAKPHPKALSKYAHEHAKDFKAFEKEAKANGYDTEYAIGAHLNGNIVTAFPLNPRNKRDEHDRTMLAHLANDAAIIALGHGNKDIDQITKSEMKDATINYLNELVSKTNVISEGIIVCKSDRCFVRYVAIRDIAKDEQIFFSYGYDYWIRRQCYYQRKPKTKEEFKEVSRIEDKLMDFFKEAAREWLKDRVNSGQKKPRWWPNDLETE